MSKIIDDAKEQARRVDGVYNIAMLDVHAALKYAEELETRVKNLENRLEGSGHALESERIKREWLMGNNEQWQARAEKAEKRIEEIIENGILPLAHDSNEWQVRAEEAEAQIKKLSGQNRTLEHNKRDIMASRDSWKDRAEKAWERAEKAEKERDEWKARYELLKFATKDEIHISMDHEERAKRAEILVRVIERGLKRYKEGEC